MLKPIRVALLFSSVALLLSFTVVAPADELSSGSWTRKGYAIHGSWSIVEDAGKRILVLSDDFKTKKGPDLKLFLSPQELSAVTGGNAVRQAVLIAKLERPQGGQRYPIPDGVDLDELPTLLLHCEKYSKLWGGATLR